MYNILPF